MLKPPPASTEPSTPVPKSGPKTLSNEALRAPVSIPPPASKKAVPETLTPPLTPPPAPMPEVATPFGTETPWMMTQERKTLTRPSADLFGLQESEGVPVGLPDLINFTGAAEEEEEEEHEEAFFADDDDELADDEEWVDESVAPAPARTAPSPPAPSAKAAPLAAPGTGTIGGIFAVGLVIGAVAGAALTALFLG